jgi:hypothetical protein
MENSSTAAVNETAEQENTQATQATQQGKNGTAPMDAAADGREADGQKQDRTFTQEELDAIIQKRLADEKRKAEQRGLMSLSERESELAKRESEFRQKELRSLAIETMTARNLPASLVDYTSFTTEEELNLKIDNLETAFKEAVQFGVEKRFKDAGYTPRGTSAGYSSGGSKGYSDSDDAFTKGLHSRK